MKNELTSEAYEALSQYRQSRAHETLAEIPFLREKGYYGTATNRLYYACYYAALALLAKHHITAGTHAGAKTLLGLHFVSKGLVSKESGRAFSNLYDSRLGRRWNVDPKTMVSTSTFSCFCNNPVFYTDVYGDTVRYGSSKERRDVFVARFFSSAFRKEFRVLKKSHLVFTYRRIENGEYGERGGLISVEDAEVTFRKPPRIPRSLR